MTLLTTVEIPTPLSVMAPRDGRGFADLPERFKAPRIFSYPRVLSWGCVVANEPSRRERDSS